MVVFNNIFLATILGGGVLANFCGAASYGGGMTSGGGNLRLPEDGSAWFLGQNQPIRSCIHLADDFGWNDSQYTGSEGMQNLIREQFGMWTKYITAKKMDWREAIFRPSVVLVFSQSCTGDEDLTFYFGQSTDEIDSYRTRFDRPASYSVRTKYDLDKGWGKGFIWFAHPKTLDSANYPDFRNTTFLRTLIGHELGHVFGVDHAPGTVMDEDVVKIMKEWQTLGIPAKAPQTIDWKHELVACENCAQVYKAPPPPSEIFKIFTGREPKKVFESTIYQGSTLFSLVLHDADGTTIFPIHLRQGDSNFFEGESRDDIFRSAILDDGAVSLSRADKTAMMARSGYVKTELGEQIEVLIIRNAKNALPIRIVMFHKTGGAVTLFEGRPFAN